MTCLELETQSLGLVFTWELTEEQCLTSDSILLPLLSLSVKFPDGRIRLYCKGADTVIYERLSPNSRHKEATQTALDVSFHGFILICTAVYSQMICTYVAICLGSVKGNTACVFCASGLCQRDLADAVLVLQRHQH